MRRLVRGRLDRIRQRVTAPRPADALSADRSAQAGRSAAPGWFIAVEGGDGAGKSTQIAALADWLRHRGFEVVATREPGGTELGRQLRDILLHRGDLGGIGTRTEALLFAADRADHIEKVVKPALARGAIVLTDRHVDSSIAYQSGGRGLPAEAVAALSAFATDGLRPDLTLLLDVDPAVARDRTAQRSAGQTAQQLAEHSAELSAQRPSGQSGGPDRLEAEPLAFHARVRAVFRARAAAEPDRYLVLDAAEPPAVITAISQDRLALLLPPSPREAAEEAERQRAIAAAEEAERAEQAARAAARQAVLDAEAQKIKDRELAAAQAEQAARQAEAARMAEQAAAERAAIEAARIEARRQAEADRAAEELRGVEHGRQLAEDAARRAEAEQVVRRAEARAKAQAREQAAADQAASAESEARTRQLVARASASASASAEESGRAAEPYHSGGTAGASESGGSVGSVGSGESRADMPSLADELFGDAQPEPSQKTRRWRSKDAR